MESSGCNDIKCILHNGREMPDTLFKALDELFED